MTKISTQGRMARGPRSLALAFVFTFMLVLTAGCAAVNHLRDAQDAFSNGAALENAARLDSAAKFPSAETSSSLAARSSYASALHSLDQLSDEQRKTLEKENLWGATLTLKALAQWRLGKYDEALSTAEDAQKLNEQLFPRDAALLKALPGLVAIDLAYARIVAADRGALDKKLVFGGLDADGNRVSGVKERLVGSDGKGGAVAILASARAMVDERHSLQSYLIQAQLAGFRNYKVALERLTEATHVPPNDPARVIAKNNLEELRKVPDSPVAYWQHLCGLD